MSDVTEEAEILPNIKVRPQEHEARVIYLTLITGTHR